MKSLGWEVICKLIPPLVSMWMNAQTHEEYAGFIGFMDNTVEFWSSSWDISHFETPLKLRIGISKKKLDVLVVRHSCHIPVLKEWLFYKGWEESVHSHSSASDARGSLRTCLPQPWTLQCHKATGVGQDPALTHGWDKLIQKDTIFLCHKYDSHLSKPCNFKIV